MSEVLFFFRVDASLTIGFGHVMRCLTLADELRRRGFKGVFICAELEGDLIQFIKNKGTEVHAINSTTLGEDYYQTKNVLKNYKNQFKILILDSYIHDIQWETQIKEHLDLMISIDDIPRVHNVDILINNNYKAEKNTFYKENMHNTKKLLGIHYTMLRTEFINTQTNYTKNDHVVHVFFGGSDNNNYTYYYCNEILRYKTKVKVHAVVSESFSYKETLKVLSSQYGDMFQYSVSPKNMADIMGKCTVALGAPGTTTWERMAVGLPSAYLATNNNQIPILKDIHNDGLGIYLGIAKKRIPSEQIEGFFEFIKDTNLQNDILIQGKDIVDGYGSRRIIDFLINTMRERGHKI